MSIDCLYNLYKKVIKGIKRMGMIIKGGVVNKTNLNGNDTGTKIAIFGDSVSTYGGVYLTPGANPSLDASYNADQDWSIAFAIRKLYPAANVVNVSRGGMTTDQALTGVMTPGQSNPFGSGNIFDWLTNHKPDKVVIRYGLAESVLRSDTTASLANIQIIIDEAKSRNMEVILIGVNPAAPNGTAGNPEYYTNDYYSNTMEARAVTINTGILTKAQQQGLKYANPRVLTIPNKSLPDGIHPYRSFGGKITRQILSNLRSQLGIETNQTYTFSSPVINSNVSEGATVTFTVTTTGLLDGTKLYWAVDTDTGAQVADVSFPSPPLGNVIINSNSGTIRITVATDALSPETDESFYVSLFATEGDLNNFTNRLTSSEVVKIINV